MIIIALKHFFFKLELFCHINDGVTGKSRTIFTRYLLK